MFSLHYVIPRGLRIQLCNLYDNRIPILSLLPSRLFLALIFSLASYPCNRARPIKDATRFRSWSIEPPRIEAHNSMPPVFTVGSVVDPSSIPSRINVRIGLILIQLGKSNRASTSIPRLSYRQRKNIAFHLRAYCSSFFFLFSIVVRKPHHTTRLLDTKTKRQWWCAVGNRSIHDKMDKRRGERNVTNSGYENRWAGGNIVIFFF